MSDIVERLHQMPSSFNDALRTMEQAADEIERLRKQLAALHNAADEAESYIASLGGVTDGTVRNERHARGADADTQRAPGNH